MKTFLLTLMGNEGSKDRLVQGFQRVLPLLSEPESCVINPLKIDRNLIEVQNGWLWSFSAGSFAQGLIPASQVRTIVCSLTRDRSNLNRLEFLLLCCDVQKKYFNRFSRYLQSLSANPVWNDANQFLIDFNNISTRENWC